MGRVSARKPLGKKVRFEVFKRDGFKCVYCGAHPPAVVLQADHVIPVSAGGTDDIDNLVTACQGCNLGKGARSLNVSPLSVAQKAAELAEREEQLAAYQEAIQARRDRLDDETWQAVHALLGEVHSVPHDTFNGIRNFIEKLGLPDVLDSADIALSSSASNRNLFRYFCGVCWRKIREQQK